MAGITATSFPPLSSASAAEPTGQQAPGAPEEARARAKQIYRQAEARYDVGDFDQAVRLFEQAYEIAPAAALLFNIGQAYRLAGNCPRALASYRSFVRLADAGTPERNTAESHMQALEAECGKRPSPGALPETGGNRSSEASQDLSGPAVRELATTSTTKGRGNYASFVGGATALAFAGAAIGAYVWNHGRYQEWEKQDRQLRNRADATAADDQRRNDELLSSIHTYDHVTVGLAIASWASLATALVFDLLETRRGEVSFLTGPGRGEVSWRARW